jgi:putative transposase
VKFAFIDEHRGPFPVGRMCVVLGVTRGGYDAWRRRPESAQARRKAELVGAIEAVHRESRSLYGSPRVHKALEAQSQTCCVNTVAKRVRLAGVRARTARRFVVRTTDSRRVIGWATADHMRSELVRQALEMALKQRRSTGPLLRPSDRGVQYASGDDQRLLASHGLGVSMGRSGEYDDNAVMESFFGTLKQELVHPARYASRTAARGRCSIEYIEVFSNRQRLHSTLGYRSPVQYEERFGSPSPRADESWGSSQSETIGSIRSTRDRTRNGYGWYAYQQTFFTSFAHRRGRNGRFSDGY